MHPHNNRHILSVMRSYVTVASSIAALSGLTIMAGWLFDIPSLKSFLPNLPATRFNTGLSFLLLGAALWLLEDDDASPAKKNMGKILAGLVLAISVLTISEYLFYLNLGIDELFIRDLESPAELFPGRISPVASLCFFLGSAALLVIGTRTAQYFSIGVSILSLAVIMNHLFEVELAERQIPVYVAIHVSVLFLLVALAIIMARPTHGMMKMLSSNQPGSKAIRLLLPTIILFTILLGWLVEWFETLNILDTSKEAILLVLLLIFVYSPLIYLIGRYINQAEEVLQNNHETYRSLFENNPHPMWVYDVKTLAFLMVNNAAINEYGYSRDEFLSMTIKDIRPKTDLPTLLNNLSQLTQPLERSSNWKHLKKDGTIITVEITSHSIDFQGRPARLVLANNITERRHAEEALSASQKRFETLIQHAPDGITLLGEDGKVKQATPSVQHILGYTPEEAKGQDAALFVHPDDLPTLASLLNVLIQNPGRVARTEYRFRHKDGSWRWLESTISSLIHEPNIEALVFNYRDITERKQAEIERQRAEQELIESETQYRQAIAAANAIPYSLDYTTNQYLFMDEGIAGLSGYSAEEFTPQLLDSLIKESTMRGRYTGMSVQEAVRQVRSGESGLLWTCDHRILTRFGEERWFSDASIQVLDDQGIPKGSIGIFQDITDRKQAEEKIKDLARFTEENPYPVLRTTFNGTIIYANPPSDILLAEWDRKVGEELPLVWKELIARLVETNSRKTVEIECREFTYAITFVPMSDRGYLNLYGRDVTERKRAEMQLRKLNTELENRVADRTLELNQANAKLERANRAKDEFLTTMSHELRTPLNSILGLSESLLEQRLEKLSERQQRSLQIVESSGRHLLTMINDILDLSKIEAGKLDYYPEVIDVNSLCWSSLAFVKEQAARKSITLTYEDDKSVSRITADPRRLKQILVNLLNNAVKFTPDHGKVTLKVTANAKEDLMQFSVIDNGIGIAKEDLKRLFKPFAQLDSRLSRHFEGTGLGLVLVQKLTDLHGGSVQVESKVEEGSRFTINIPWGQETAGQLFADSRDETLAHGPLQQTEFLKEPPTHERVILLAEDNEANTLTISEYLETHGYRMVNAHNGLEAIKLAEETSPDIILMDIQMPAMDGLEAIHHLRENPRFKTTPIIALTALAMPSDRERCLKAGADEYMSKPVRLRELNEAIKDFLEKVVDES